MKTSASLALGACLLLLPLALGSSQAAQPRVIGLEESLALALDQGEDAILAARTLDAARAAHAINLGKDSWSITATGAYTLGDSFSFGGYDSTTNTTAASNYSTAIGKAGGSGKSLAHNLSGGLTLSTGNYSSANPGTKLAFTASSVIPGPDSTAKSSTVLGFALTQNIWDGYPGGQTKAAVAKSALTLTAKELQAALSKSTIKASVQKAYITMLSAQRTLALRQSISDKQRSLLNQIQAIFAIKQASTIDLQTAKINSMTADLDVETSKHDVALARQRLANLLGLGPGVDFAVSDLPEDAMPAASLEDAIAIGLKQRLELAVADLSARSSSIDVVVAKGLGQPTVSLTGGLSYATYNDVDGEYASLGIKLSLPVLDGGGSSSQARQAQALVDGYLSQRRSLEKTISADIRDAWWLATIQKQKIDLALQSRDLYDAQLALVKAQNSFGTATNQDLLTASVNAANAAAAWATAKYNYLLAVLTLETAMGL